MDRDALDAFVGENLEAMSEQEAVAVLTNRYCTPQICQKIAQTVRLTSYYSVRQKLVSNRLTPQGHSLKFVHYLFWSDLLRLSTDVRIPPTVRRAIDNQLLNRLTQLALGERVATARSCSREVLKALLFDRDPKVFNSLLINGRLTEEDLVMLIASERATPEQLQMISDDRKWSFRYDIRRALVLNKSTLRAVAARQLRHLRSRDLREIATNPSTSTYLLRCIERVREEREGPAEAELTDSDYNSSNG